MQQRPARVVQFPSDRSLGTLSVRRAGAEVWEEHGEARGAVQVPEGASLRLRVAPPAALQELARLGPDDLQEVELFGILTSDWIPEEEVGLAALTRLTGLQRLDLSCTEVTDVGLVHLAQLTALHELNLWETEVTDAGLAHLIALTQLQHLNLNNAGITDAGLAHLAALTQLQWLNLGGTRVTDAGLRHLAGLTQLQWLDLWGTRVTDAGLLQLRTALPDCDISRQGA